MGKLDEVSATTLQRHLNDATGAKAAKRAMVALAYKDGESVSAMSERYGIPISTIYAWLDRFEDRPVSEALADESRPGRPSKLDSNQREALDSTLREPPTAVGYDKKEWTVELVQQHIEEEYSISYSVGHLREEYGDIVG